MKISKFPLTVSKKSNNFIKLLTIKKELILFNKLKNYHTPYHKNKDINLIDLKNINYKIIKSNQISGKTILKNKRSKKLLIMVLSN